jgi:hypothetical protein
VFGRSAGKICRDEESVLVTDEGEFVDEKEGWLADECENRSGVDDRVPMVQSCRSSVLAATVKREKLDDQDELTICRAERRLANV